MLTTIKEYVAKIFELRENIQHEEVIRDIYSNISVKGYNLWLLVCSCILASIGLNTNSTAVIIGAMLISPLMSPILGIGLSFAIHDWDMLRHSSRNFLIATIGGLSISALYFYISPLKDMTEELNARTQPTLLDVGVALSGGVAGIVSLARRDRTNAIPGVAIATALMPPVCTAGFGVAQGDISAFLGSLYLFFLNAIFISIATYGVVKYLDFPVVADLTPKLKRRTFLLMGVFLLIFILPSGVFFYSLYQDNRVRDSINKWVIQPIKVEGNEILKWETTNASGNKKVKVYIAGGADGETLQKHYNEILQANGLKEYRLQIIRLNLSKEEMYSINTEAARNVLQAVLAEKQAADSLIRNKTQVVSASQLFQETKALLPEIDTVFITSLDNSSIKIALAKTLPHTSLAWKKQKEEGLRFFLRKRLSVDSVRVYWITD